MNTQEILEERQSTHGEFDDNAQITDDIMKVLSGSRNWSDAPSAFRVGAFHIVHKLARAFSGNLTFNDHWKDIQGYAKLMEDKCHRTKELFCSECSSAVTHLFPDGKCRGCTTLGRPAPEFIPGTQMCPKCKALHPFTDRSPYCDRCLTES